jgi:hypothetical protein
MITLIMRVFPSTTGIEEYKAVQELECRGQLVSQPEKEDII